MNHSLFVSTLFLVTLILLSGEVSAQYSSQTQSSRTNDELSGVLLAEVPPGHPSEESMVDSHYVPVAGKTVGVVPPRDYSVEQLSELRLQYGLSAVRVDPNAQQYDNALQAGYTPSTIMVAIFDLYTTVDNFPGAWYYIDEPVEHDCYGHTGGSHLFSPQELATIHDYVHQIRPDARFVISSYKRCSHNQIASTYCDVMMYSGYKNWDELSLPICHVNIGWGDEWETPWLPGNQNQSDSWTDMQNTYGSKYSMTWINGGGDEYNDLFGHANSLGLTYVWVWYGGPIDSTTLESSCHAAWQNGWLNKVPGNPSDVEDVEEKALPAGYALEQNYPNPFNPSTKIQFTLPKASHVKLEVYNALGERIATLADETRQAGYYSEQFNATGLASGLYFYRLQANDFVETKKLLLIR
ncbi:MAG: T9SS type A sorting domain-containing protein [Ignavibacteria bacterium]|nr:T9SS type A sorting domain-containing protein [Ignavibacteria bacterium]